jgi:hypothetical protein
MHRAFKLSDEEAGRQMQSSGEEAGRLCVQRGHTYIVGHKEARMAGTDERSAMRAASRNSFRN